MALITINNQVADALPAERERGLIAKFDGHFVCGVDYYEQEDASASFGAMTAIVEVSFSDPENESGYIFDADPSNKIAMAIQPSGQLFVYFAGQVTATPDSTWREGLLAGDVIQLAFVVNSSNQYFIYANGVKEQGPIGKAATSVDNLKMTLGGNSVGGELINGTVHSFRLFNRALTQGEIASYVDGTPFDALSDASLVVPMTDAFHIDASNAKAVDGTPVVISGAAKLTDRRGYAFSGSDYMNIDLSDGRLDGTGDKTFVVVAKQSNEGTEYFFDSEPDRAYLLLYSDGRYQGGMPGSPGAIPLSTWGQYFNRSGFNVFVLRREGGTISTWINGAKVSEASVSIEDLDINSVYIGTRATIGANLNGEVYWFGSWNRALTQLEIADLGQRIRAGLNEV
jgi:hypothetical protein